MSVTNRCLAILAVSALGALGAPPVAAPARAQDAAGPESRVLQYWARRQAKDLAGAWAFYCADYQARVPQPQFMQMTRLLRFDLRDLKVAKADVRGGKADVTIAYTFSLPTIPGQSLAGQSSDTWSKGADGQWCKDDEPLVLPFPASAISPGPPAGAPGAAPPAPPPAPPQVPNPDPPKPATPPTTDPGAPARR